jgi:hypothetical protein
VRGDPRRVAGVGTAAALSAIIIAATGAALFWPRGRRMEKAGGRLGPPGLSLAAVKEQHCHPAATAVALNHDP